MTFAKLLKSPHDEFIDSSGWEVRLPYKTQSDKYLRLKNLTIVDKSSLVKLVISVGLIDLLVMVILDQLNLNEVLAIAIDTTVLSISAYLLGRHFIFQSVFKYFETQQNTILSTMAEGFVLQDDKTQILNFNQSALQILAMTEDQILGKTSLDPSWKAIKSDGSDFPGEEHPAVMSLKTGQTIRNVIMGVTLSDSSIRWININAVPVFTNKESKKAYSVIVTFSDITKERQNQTQLQLANERFQAAAEAVRFGIWDWNLKTGLLIWDPIMYEIFEIKKEDFSGDYDAFEKTLIPESALKIKQNLDETFQNKKSEFVGEFEIKSKSQKIKHIAAKAKCFYDQNGHIEKLIGFNWDISQEVEFKKQIEDQQLQLSSQLKMASLGEMAGGIAHEINNPLSIIKGRAAQLMRNIDQDRFDKEIAKKYLDAIVVTSDRIAKIITGLRSFSRNAENDLLENFSISTIVNETLSLCQERFKNHEILLDNYIAQDVIIKCRPTQISQVLLNLINNSFDAVSQLKEKWVRLDIKMISEKELMLSVTDSGSGIDQATAQKIMQPFFTTKGIGKGTGLGLSISKGIIEDHGGRLVLNSENKNTEFRIYLPIESQSVV